MAQPPKTGVARKVWELSDKEIDAIFGDEEEGE